MRQYVAPLLFAVVAALLVPISAEAQYTDANCAAIIDSDGTRVARYQGGSAVLFNHQGRIVRFSLVSKTRLDANADLYFTESNCTGCDPSEEVGQSSRLD